jgi:biopolymer transport protein ExbD
MKIPIDTGPDAGFDMSPMIDMVFQLLIFFMIASRFSVQQNIELDIPTAEKAIVPKERHERFTVNVLQDGGICIYGRATPVTPDELRAALKREKETDPATKVYIRADQDADFVHVRKVMTIMAEEGLDDSIFGAFIPN